MSPNIWHSGGPLREAVKSEAAKFDKQNFFPFMSHLNRQRWYEIIRYYPTWHSVARASLDKKATETKGGAD